MWATTLSLLSCWVGCGLPGLRWPQPSWLVPAPHTCPSRWWQWQGYRRDSGDTQASWSPDSKLTPYLSHHFLLVPSRYQTSPDSMRERASQSQSKQGRTVFPNQWPHWNRLPQPQLAACQGTRKKSSGQKQDDVRGCRSSWCHTGAPLENDDSP